MKMNKKLNFYIIDDDSIYQFTLKKAIEQLDAANKIFAFFDGEEALNFMLEKQNSTEDLPDVILLDINMPVMDGFQFVEEYRKVKQKFDKKITIYMISSSVDRADVDKAKGVDEISKYFSKPIEYKLKHIFEDLLNEEVDV